MASNSSKPAVDPSSTADSKAPSHVELAKAQWASLTPATRDGVKLSVAGVLGAVIGATLLS